MKSRFGDEKKKKKKAGEDLGVCVLNLKIV